MTKRRWRALLLAAAVAGGFALASCTPEEIAIDAIVQNFPGSIAGQAVNVARCESSLDPGAVSPGGGNFGLFQINSVHQGLVQSMGYSWNDILNPYINADVAREIYDEAGGWGPWACAWAA